MDTQSLGCQKPFSSRRMVRQVQMALVISAALGWWAGPASGAILNVGTCVRGGYSTISAAVAAAKAGDTVSVCPGTYQEIVTITQNLTIVGKSTSNTAILEYPASDQCPNSLPSDRCPQILVENHATAQIERLTIDGSGFTNCPELDPLGIMFYDASGGALYNTIENQGSPAGCAPGSGDAILGTQDDGKKYAFTAQGNYIRNFLTAGVYASGVAANIVNNSISGEINEDTGIFLNQSKGSSALNNQIWGDGSSASQTGIEVNSSSNTALTRNTITDVYIAIGSNASNYSTLNANALTDTARGIVAICSSNNTLVSNKVYNHLSLNAVSGVNLVDCAPLVGGSDDNLLNGNSFNGMCAGILTGSAANTGNKFINNSFKNVGVDMKSGNTCP